MWTNKDMVCKKNADANETRWFGAGSVLDTTVRLGVKFLRECRLADDPREIRRVVNTVRQLEEVRFKVVEVGTLKEGKSATQNKISI